MIKSYSTKFLLVFAVLILATAAYDPTPFPPPPPQTTTDINGVFVASQIGSTFLNYQITVTINNPDISIQGCNRLWSTFVYDSATQRIRFEDFASTRRGCPNDQDSFIIESFKSVRRAFRQNNFIVLLNAQGLQVLRLQQSDTVVVQPPVLPQPPIVNQPSYPPLVNQPALPPVLPVQPNPFPFPSVVQPTPLPFPTPVPSFQIQGQYDLTIPALQIVITNNAYRVSGCNSHSINIQRSADGTVRFTLASSTRKACNNDFDRYYLQAFNLGRYLDSNGNSFRVLDENRRVLLDIIFKSSGSYLLSIPSVNLVVDNQSFSFEGCNVNTIQYNLNGASISFGRAESTLRSCLFYDYDQFILDSIKASNSCQRANQGLILSNQGVNLVIAVVKSFGQPTTIITIPQIPTPVVIPSPIYPTNPVYDYQVPNIILPGVAPITLKGRYVFNAQSSNLPAVVVTFDDEYLQFQACNVHRYPYAAYSDGLFLMLQGGASTQRSCSLNQDSYYLDLIRSINRFQKLENGFSFYSNGVPVATIAVKARNEIVTFNVINGGYQLQIPGLEATVSQNTISFRGCNSVSIPYQLLSDGSISFGRATTTLIACDRDADQVYIKAITSSRAIRQTTQGYSFIGASGSQLVKFISYFGNQGYQSFNGRYRIQLPNAGIRLKIADGVFTLSGCNTFTFKFDLADSGSIIFGGISSTKVYCQVDYDNIFLFNLLKAQTIAVIDSSISFKNGNNEEVVRAVNFDKNIVTKQPIYLDPKSPVVHKTEFQLSDGRYRLNIVRSNVKPINASISQNTITITGCNTHTYSYYAVSDGTITFTLQGSTRVYCVDDYDKYFISALSEASKFETMKGMYTIFDAKEKSILQFVAIGNFDLASPVDPGYNNYPVPTPLPLPLPLPLPFPSELPDPAPLPIPDNFNPFPTPIIPDSFISLKGKYRFRFPKIGLQVLNGSFAFRGGCATHRVPCSYKNKNIFFGNPISSDGRCNKKSDKFFLNLIPKILTFKRTKNLFTFFNNKFQSLFNADLSDTKSNYQILPGLSAGSYQAQLPNIDLQFDDNRVFLNGCSGAGFGYKASSNGAFTFSNDATSCANDYFDTFTNAFESVAKYQKVSDGFILQDINGNEKGRCINY